MKTARSLIFTLTLILGLCQGSVAMAYTGTYGVVPTLFGGPDNVTVTNFDLDAEANETLTIPMNLSYVHSMVITMDDDTNSHILIKEYPSLSTDTFDVIVPQKVNDALISATVYIWAPNLPTVIVHHEHKGEPIELVTATKVEPEVAGPNGTVLWAFTVDSFSSFSYFNPGTQQQQSLTTIFSFGAWFLLIWFAALAPLALRNR